MTSGIIFDVDFRKSMKILHIFDTHMYIRSIIKNVDHFLNLQGPMSPEIISLLEIQNFLAGPFVLRRTYVGFLGQK